MILLLRQTVSRILNSQNCLTKMQYREFEGPGIATGVWVEGGGRGMKIAAKKIEKVGRLLKKRLKCGRDKSPGLVIRHQAARPSHSIDLAGRLAVWMRL